MSVLVRTRARAAPTRRDAAASRRDHSIGHGIGINPRCPGDTAVSRVIAVLARFINETSRRGSTPASLAPFLPLLLDVGRSCS
jgi:hypothetical protein